MEVRHVILIIVIIVLIFVIWNNGEKWKNMYKVEGCGAIGETANNYATVSFYISTSATDHYGLKLGALGSDNKNSLCYYGEYLSHCTETFGLIYRNNDTLTLTPGKNEDITCGYTTNGNKSYILTDNIFYYCVIVIYSDKSIQDDNPPLPNSIKSRRNKTLGHWTNAGRIASSLEGLFHNYMQKYINEPTHRGYFWAPKSVPRILNSSTNRNDYYFDSEFYLGTDNSVQTGTRINPELLYAKKFFDYMENKIRNFLIGNIIDNVIDENIWYNLSLRENYYDSDDAVKETINNN